MKKPKSKDLADLKMVQRLSAEDQAELENYLSQYNEVPEQIPLKKWYRSKTLWVNLLSIVSIILSSHTGLYISSELMVSLLALINIVLRMITKEKIEWSVD